MNKIKIISVLGLVYVMAACGGGSDDPVPTPTINEPDTIPVVEDLGEDTCQLVNKSVVVGANGGECKIVVKTNRMHTLSTTSGWITINDEPRSVSDYEYTITIAGNTGVAREGVVKITFEGTKKSKVLDFKVTQTAVGEDAGELSFGNGINDMTENEWVQEVVTITKRYARSVAINDFINGDVTEAEIDASAGVFALLELGDYVETSLVDGIESGELSLTYVGGAISYESGGTLNQNVVGGDNVKVPTGYKYGFSLGADGKVIRKNESTAVAMTI